MNETPKNLTIPDPQRLAQTTRESFPLLIKRLHEQMLLVAMGGGYHIETYVERELAQAFESAGFVVTPMATPESSGHSAGPDTPQYDISWDPTASQPR